MRALLWALCALLFAASLPAHAAVIVSPGPLEAIWLGEDLDCQVDHVADYYSQFYHPTAKPGDCGTFLVVGDTLYSAKADDWVTAAYMGTAVPFTSVVQTTPIGTGSKNFPFTVETRAMAGTTIELIQQDEYVIGESVYRTNVTVRNVGNEIAKIILYRAGDCFLQNDDHGHGALEEGKVTCSLHPHNDPPERLIEWVDLTGEAKRYHAFYKDVWEWIESRQPFPDTCMCTTYLDNGAGLSWNFTLAPGESTYRDHLTRFEPGPQPVPEPPKEPEPEPQPEPEPEPTPAPPASGPAVSENEAPKKHIPKDGIDDARFYADQDGDGVADGHDVCVFVPDPDQADLDGDGIGDLCDDDQDGDDIPDEVDPCPRAAGLDDRDGDGMADVCDDDPDGDGIFAGDVCPMDFDPAQLDSDGDGVGDACTFTTVTSNEPLRLREGHRGTTSLHDGAEPGASPTMPAWLPILLAASILAFVLMVLRGSRDP